MAAADATLLARTGEIRRETLRGADGFTRVGQDAAGRWWLLDAQARPFFCRAVHGVRRASEGPDVPAPRDSAVRLRTWGFNAVGVGGDDTGWNDGFAFLAAVNFCDAAGVLIAPGLRLPDVFDPRWPARAREHAAKLCTPLAANQNLIGWVGDDGLAWAQPPITHGPNAIAETKPALLQLCLSLEPSFAAYHAAWEFALALHGGSLEALARAWSIPLANKEVVREHTRSERGFATRGYVRDAGRWTREFARRYFTSTSDAIRAADPNHLLLGARSVGAVGPHVIAENVYPAVDVALRHWLELPGAANVPVLASDVSWDEPALLRPASSRDRQLTSVERMLRRGRATLERFARHPAVVGYVWRQWQDDPGEQPPFARGLVHANGSEAREHTELLANFNARAETLRRAAPAEILS